jgi:serine protease
MQLRSWAMSALAVLATALFCQRGSGATIRVPSDRATIQAGINAAANGDTVLIAPGTYSENINFSGKAITVTSEQGPQVTIIDVATLLLWFLSPMVKVRSLY